MMDDPAPEPGPLTTENFLISLVFFLIVVGLFVAEICVNYHPVKLTALFIFLFWLPLIAVHEAGHALVAVLLGWRVHRLVIGMGRPLLRFSVGRTPVEIRLFPVQGFVLPAPTNLRAPRLKSALIYFAGPGAELLVLGLLTLIVGPAAMLSRTENLWLLAAQSLAVAVLLSAFFNLVPHYAHSQSGRVPNDGLGIIYSFLCSREDYARLLEDPDSAWRPEREEEQDDWYDR
jgi:Peptidase family M50